MRTFPSPTALTVLLGSTLLAGCVSVPPLPPRAEMRPATSYTADATLAPAMTETAWPETDWWHAYGDRQLDALIDEGLKGSPDVAAAVARLRAAEGYRQQAGGALLPRIDATGTVGGVKQSYNNGIPADFVPKGWNSTGNIGLNFDFDLDLWGKNRAALSAATSDQEAARLDLEEARLLLSTGIASAYADLAQYHAERDVQAAAVKVRTDSQTLVANRVATGLDTRAELKQADALVSADRARLTAIDEAIGLTRNRIAALLGAGPDRGRALDRPSAVIRARGVPQGVTTDLIGRRPDIAAARMRVEAAAARIKVARADFYPKISIEALVGFQSFGLSNLLKGGSFMGNAGPAVSLPIFHGGQIKGQYRVARATYDEAVANYDRQVTDAFRQLADAVTSQAQLSQQVAQQRQAVSDAEEAYSLALARYEGGLSTYLNVLSAQDTVLQNRRTLTDLQARAFALDIALVRALGGGAIAPPAQQAANAVKD